MASETSDRAASTQPLRAAALGALLGVLLGSAGAWRFVLGPEEYLTNGLVWLARDALARWVLRGLVLGGLAGFLAALVPHSFARRGARVPGWAWGAACGLGALAGLAGVVWLRASGAHCDRPEGWVPFALAGLAGSALAPAASRALFTAHASAAVVGLALVAILASASTRPRPAGPSLLLLSIDTLRADRLGCYGYERAATPNLDALAREGWLWETVIASSSVTLPAMATVMTGVDPPLHGAHYNGFYRLGRPAVTLSELLAERGYTTGAAVGNFALERRFQIGQGFASFDDRMTQRMGPETPPAQPAAGLNWWLAHAQSEPTQRLASEITDAGLAWLAEHGDEPFFLWLHYMDPHGPYTPPPEHRGPDPYDGEVAFVDAEIGRLLAGHEARFPGRDTVVVVVADHGESLGEHGVTGHVFALYEEMLRVPFLLRRRGVLESGRRIAEPLRGREVRREILRALELEPGSAPREGEWWAYSQTYQPLIAGSGRPIRSLRGPRWKLIEQEDGAQSLYDLEADPYEQRNLVTEQAAEVARLRALLAELAGGPQGEPLAVDDETLDRLRALGYVE